MASKPGNDMRTALHNITMAAANASMSRDVLIERIAAFADNPTKDDLRRLQGAVMLGYVAGRIARNAGRASATQDDVGAGASLLAKKGANAAKAAPNGKRTADEERIYSGATSYWSSLAIRAGAAPEAATGTGRSAGGRASAAKRKARTSQVGAVEVVQANVTAKAPKAVPEQPRSKPVTPTEMMAHVHASAATLMGYVEAHGALLLPKSLAALKRHIKAIQAMPAPTH